MGWGNPSVLGAIITGILLLIAFPVIESRVEDPMFRLNLLKYGFSPLQTPPLS